MQREGLSYDSPVPLYHQIFLSLQTEIRSGHYQRDARFPGSQHLAERFGVSKATTGRALQELIRSKLLTSARGRGFSVIAEFSAQAEPVLEVVGGDITSIPNCHIRVLNESYGPVPAEVAELFDDSARAKLLFKQSVICKSGDAIAHSRHWQAQEKLVLGRGGVPVNGLAKTRDEISAERASKACVQLLGLSPNDPVLCSDRYCYNTDGSLQAFSQTRFHPDRYRLVTQMSN